jgi:hypothetical protein
MIREANPMPNMIKPFDEETFLLAIRKALGHPDP